METGGGLLVGEDDTGDVGEEEEEVTETGASREASGNRKDKETEGEEETMEEGEA